MTKGYGLTVDDIDWSCPADLEPYSKAYQLEFQNIDNYIHGIFGNYFISALSVTIDHMLNEQAKSEYMRETMLEDMGLTEEERKEKARKAFIEKMKALEKSWKDNHKGSS